MRGITGMRQVAAASPGGRGGGSRPGGPAAPAGWTSAHASWAMKLRTVAAANPGKGEGR